MSLHLDKLSEALSNNDMRHSVSSTVGPFFLPLPTNGNARKAMTASLVPSCPTIPTTTPKTVNSSYTLDTATAAKLGIQFIGTGNAAVDQNMKVFIREFMKYNTCQSADGLATLQYGAVWRATAIVTAEDASADISFPIVAASATLRKVSAQVTITSQGFVDQTKIDAAGQVAMSDASGGLDVKSFVQFDQDLNKTLDVVIASAVVTPLELIGIANNTTEDLFESVVKTFALTYIAQGRGCLDPIADFPVKSAQVEQIIRDAYSALSSQPCDASDPMVQLAAQRILNGITINT